MILKTYEQFGGPLLLPPHNPEDDENKVVRTLAQLYLSCNSDIIATGNKINAICNNGYYVRVTHVGTKLKLIKHNEPSNIFGVEAGRTISIGRNSSIHIPDDSIVIYIRVDDSLFVLSVKDNYEMIFIQPKVVVSHHDPYGEEDWGED